MTSTEASSFAALSATQRQRLDRFGRAFDAVDPMDYDLFIGPSADDEATDAARAAAISALGSGARLEAARRAMATFTEAAGRAIARRQPVPEVMLAPRPGGNAAERARFYIGLERAVAAVLAWDQLTDRERATLLGPWLHAVATLVEPSWQEPAP